MKSLSSHRLLWLIPCVLIIQSCAIGQIMDVPSKEELSRIEKSRVFPNSYDAVWAATIKSLTNSGVSIQSQDKESGNISTDWVLEKEAVGIFTTGSRARATILLEKQGKNATLVTVNPTFQIRVASKANWEPTPRKKRHVDAEKRFLDEIQKNL